MVTNRPKAMVIAYTIIFIVFTGSIVFGLDYFGLNLSEVLRYSGVINDNIVSQDPNYFTVQDGSPIIPLGEVGSWDAGMILVSDIVFHDEQYYLFYTGQSASHPRQAIGYATSADGLIWTKSDHNPIFAADDTGFDAHSVSNPTVMHDGEQWIMVYSAHAVTPQLPPGTAIGRATTTDLESNWQRDTEPILRTGSGVAWDATGIIPNQILQMIDGYRLYYSGTLHGIVSHIGLATSADGIVWEKYDNPNTTNARFRDSDPIFLPNMSGRWDSGVQWRGDIFLVEGGWGMIYHGTTLGRPADVSQLALGYAVSSDGIQWRSLDDNPIFLLDNRFPQNPEVVHRDDEMWLYYTSFSWEGELPQVERAVGHVPTQ